MKLLHVSQGYFPAMGGTEWLMTRLSEELVCQFGDRVDVFTTNCYGGDAFYNPKLPAMPVGWEDREGVKVRRFPVRRRFSRAIHALQFGLLKAGLPVPETVRVWGDGPVMPGLKSAVRQSDADLVAVSSFPLLHMFQTLDAAQSAGKPCIFYGGLHPEDPWGFQRKMIYKAIPQADFYVGYTGYETDYVVSRGMPRERTAAIGLGVDPEPFLAADVAEAKRRLGVEGVPLVGYIGQIVPHKGVDTLVRAMPAVWQHHPETRLLIAGARRQFADVLEGMLAQWPEEQRKKVTFIYNFKTEEKPWLYAAVDVFAYPSSFESFGIAFLEAWACGKPVIGCRKGAIPWVVNGGRDGLIVPYGSPDQLGEAVISLLSNRAWAAALGEAGRAKTLSGYTWPIVAQKFRAVYREVLARRGKTID